MIQKHTFKYISQTALIFVLFLFFGTSCRKNKGETQAQYNDIEEWVFAPGQIEWDNAYNLTAQTDGVLLNADFDIGDLYLKGQLIANIDNANNIINSYAAQEQLKISEENIQPNAPALEQLKQNIKFAEIKYKQDQSVAERYERLFKNEGIAKIELENKQIAAANSLSSLNALNKQFDLLTQQAKQQLIIAKSQLKNNVVFQSYNQVKAIQSGTIIKKHKSTGDYVRKGDLIASIADSSKIEIVLTVDENSINKIKIGQLVKIQLNTDKSKIYKGKISEILSTFDATTQSFICKVILDEPILNAYNIYGTPLEGNILTGVKKQVLLIPRKYLGYGNKVRLKGKNEMVTVKTGIISTEFVEITEGLSSKDVLLPLKP